MQQKSIHIGGVEVPIIIEGVEEWFPVSFITTKVVLRSGKGGLINKGNRDKYNKYLKNYTIVFGDKNTQQCRCISKIGLIELLNHTHIGRMSSEQRIAQNNLHEYLGLKLLPIDEQDVNEYKDEWFKEIDKYTKEIIEEELSKCDCIIRRCSKCSNHLPLTNKFYSLDVRSDKGFTKVCKVCSGKLEKFVNKDDLRRYKIKEGEELLKKLSNGYITDVFNAYKIGKINRLPDCYENKESYKYMIKYLFDNGKINKDNLTLDYLSDECGLKGIYKYFRMNDIYKLLFGEDFYYYAWKYPNFKFKYIKLTYEIANIIVNNYVKEKNIIIDDDLSYHYEELFGECGISVLSNKDILYFIV